MYNINIKNSFIIALKYIYNKKANILQWEHEYQCLPSISILWISKFLEKKVNLEKKMWTFKSFNRSPGEPQNAGFCTIYPKAPAIWGRSLNQLFSSECTIRYDINNLTDI
jgi:hypothetical protein